MGAVHKELRRVIVPDLRSETRATGGPGTQGHAAVFNTRTLIGSRSWGFVEKIEPGAFTSVLASNPDVRLLKNHNPDFLYARTKSGTLRLVQDDLGLNHEADLPDTQDARDLSVLIGRRDLDQMSFAFTVKTDRWTVLDDDDPDFPGMEERTILEFGDLFDVAVVTYPAYEDTDVSLRSTASAEPELAAYSRMRASRTLTEKRLRLLNSQMEALRA